MKGAEIMLGENIKNIRKSKGLSQEDLALRLNVVRQTVSKWETGLSVPDSEMLIKIAEVLETSVSEILGEAVSEKPSDGIKELAEKLESLNMQISKMGESKRKTRRTAFIALSFASLIILMINVCLIFYKNYEMNSIGIIGGADGPTAIFISGHMPQEVMIIFALLLLAVSAIGIYINRRK